MEVINWIMAHWLEITAAVTSLVAAASVIVKLTPTPKDDEVLSVVMKVLTALALTPKK